MKIVEKIESGEWYWAKSKNYEWYNVIIQITGDYPFFRIKGYDFSNREEIRDISVIDEVGPKIENPK